MREETEKLKIKINQEFLWKIKKNGRVVEGGKQRIAETMRRYRDNRKVVLKGRFVKKKKFRKIQT